MSGYDSENEDQPRNIINVHGDFYVLNSDPRTTFKLRDFAPQVQLADGRMVPFKGVIALRPVADPSAVTRAQTAMGNGAAGIWTGTLFVAPDDMSPEFMFPVRLVNSTDNGAHRERFAIRRRFVPAVSDLKTMMVYTDGACAANGQAAPRGGYAFVFNGTSEGTVSGALENTGPDRQVHIHTNNRAELRAVIAALKFRTWWGESWNRVVIVTDSEYVAKGATTWMRNWAANGWRKAGSKRERVVNRDLWEALSELMGAYAAGGCEVSFWVVPRAWNALADAAAKAASQLDGVAKYENTLGFLC